MKASGRPPGDRPPRLGEGDRCPLCGAVSGVSENDGEYLCLVCGAPRVLVDGIVQRGGTEKPLLERARSLKLRRAALGVVAGIALALGVVSATFASVAALFIGAKGLLLGGAALVPLLVSLASWVAARRSTTAIHDAMAEAEVTVAKELIAGGDARDASALTRLMRLSPGRAEELFGRAEVERLLDEPADLPPLDRVRVRAQAEGEADAKSEEDVLAAETDAALRNRAR